MSAVLPPTGTPVSAREREVLDLLGDQLTYAQIGARLFISDRTVETHVESLRRKFGASDRRDLVRRAAAQTVVPVPVRLPASLSTFVGRARELAEVTTELEQARLVTVVGAGGVGKTRLALELAEGLAGTLPGGVWYADLVPVTEPALLPGAVATALGRGGGSELSAEGALAAHLGDGAALLVLDNGEHLVDAVARLTERLLRDCPQLRILVTSRVRLVLPHERTYLLGGLSLPDDEADPGTGDAVELFSARAGRAAAQADPAIIAEICRGLGGVALAIELAAARMPALGPVGLRAALTHQLDLLTGGARVAPRHRSLQETFDWSHRMLGPVEQAVLGRVSVFAAAFDLEAAVLVVAFGQVGPADVRAALLTLTEHSWLAAVPGPAGLGFRALEPVRQFGDRTMPAADRDVVRGRHLDWALVAAGELLAAEPGGSGQSSSDEWAAAVDNRVDDLRSAWEWARSRSGRRDDAGLLGLELVQLLFLRGRLREAQAAAEQVAVQPGRAHERAVGYELAAAIAKSRVMGEAALRLDLAAAAAYAEAGEPVASALAAARAAEHSVRFEGMYGLPVADEERDLLLERAASAAAGHPHAEAAVLSARAHYAYFDPVASPEKALAAVAAGEAVGDPLLVSSALDAVTVLLMRDGQVRAAADAALSRVAPLQALSVKDHGPMVALELKDALHTAGFVGVGVGELRTGRDLARRQAALGFLREDRDLATEDLFAPAALSGDWHEALAICEEFRAAWVRSGRPVAPGRAMAPAAVALIYGLVGDQEERAEWLRVFLAMRGEGGQVVVGDSGLAVAAGAPPTGYDLVFDAVLLLHHGLSAQAYDLLTNDNDEGLLFHRRLFGGWILALTAEAAVLSAASDQSERVAEAVLGEGNRVAAALAVRAEALARDDSAGLAAAASVLDDLGCPYQGARTRSLLSERSGSRTL